MQRENKKSLIMLICGFLLILISISALVINTYSNRASAVDLGGHNWAEDYSLTEWRTVKIQPIAVPGSDLSGLVTTPGRLCLGPSKWHVDGNIQGQSFTEDWESQAWQTPNTNTTTGSTRLKASFSFENLTDSQVQNGTSDQRCLGYFPIKAATNPLFPDILSEVEVYYPVGSYGFYWTNSDSQQNRFEEWGSGSSYPTLWKITGIMP